MSAVVTEISRSPEETAELACRLALSARAGEVYALEGDLGAGKTVFAQGFARGLGVPRDVTVSSPTYTILHIYEGGRLKLFHFDAYRITDDSEADDIGLDDYIFGDGVCLIEWASRVSGLLPEGEKLIKVFLDRTEEADTRRIRVERADAA